MHNFHTLNESDKKQHHDKILNLANNFGGQNYFLQLLESIREEKSHPLTASNHIFNIELGSISWNKVIFTQTLNTLIKARINEGKQDNLLPKENEKNHKKVLNMIRTLKPIVFQVKPSNTNEGKGFFFQAFDITSKEKIKLNPTFDTLFFSSIESVKKVLQYKPKA
jgi:flagellar biosynthesis/type III secretory pathway chaperone